MNVQTTIEKKITAGITAEFLEIENESYHHAVPDNSETHFKIVIVSEMFTSLSLLQRHRLVNKILKDELAGPVHALALHTYTPLQWDEKHRIAPDSADCLGGGK